MRYDITKKDNGIEIHGVNDFEPRDIFECGQSFRWYMEDDGSYTGTAMGRVINVSKHDDSVFINNTDEDEYTSIWHHYFDMDRDYGEIKKELGTDEVLREAIKYGEGIRILNQDEWETLISFIISANNRIPMIKLAVKKLSQTWGNPIKFNGNVYYTFPGPEKLAAVEIEELEKCNTGFRAKYIKETAAMVLRGEVDLYNLKNAGYETAMNELMKLPGVGPKVAGCVMLFSMGYSQAFPVDVWVKKVMQHFYLAPDVSLPKIQRYGQEKFGMMAGFAQQYLFYYARETKLKETID